MAQLKDTLITGDLRVTDNIAADTAQITILKAKTTSSTSETNFGPGTVGEVLKSNGTNTYWASNDAVTTASVSGKTVTFTKGNGSTFSITTQDTNTTYANFSAPTSSAAGAAGLVPAPASNTMNYILTASGWKNTASAAYASKAGTANYSTYDSAGQQINTTYIKNASVSGKVVTFTKGNGGTFSITTQDTNTTYANFTPATTSAAGAAGLIPAPTSAQYSYVLSAHGWTNVIDCGYEG